MESGPIIRALGEQDLADASAIYGRCFGDDWPESSLRGLLRTPGTWGLMAVDGSPVGFVLARVVAREGEILTIGVDPAHQRRGVGRHLMLAAIALARPHADAFFLEVGTDNPAALTLYSALGFHQVGLRKDYYRRPNNTRVDAQILRLDMDELVEI